MSHARKRDGWTSVMTAGDQVGAAKCFAACEGWRKAKKGRRVQWRPGDPQHNEPAFVVEIKEEAP